MSWWPVCFRHRTIGNFPPRWCHAQPSKPCRLRASRCATSSGTNVVAPFSKKHQKNPKKKTQTSFPRRATTEQTRLDSSFCFLGDRAWPFPQPRDRLDTCPNRRTRSLALKPIHQLVAPTTLVRCHLAPLSLFLSSCRPVSILPACSSFPP